MDIKALIRYFTNNRPHLKRFVRTRINTSKFYLPGYERSFLPQVIYMVLNGRCNLKCKMCDVGTHTLDTSFYDKLALFKGDIDLDRLKTFVDSVQHFNPLISFTSTEPLLYKWLTEISRYIKSKNMDLSITTNGYLLPKFAEEFVKTGVDSISISLDGPSHIHNEIRGVSDSFEKAIDGLERLERLKRKYNKKYPLVSINYTITEYNYDQLVNFINYMDKYDIALYTFSHSNFITPEMSVSHNTNFEHIGHSRPTCITNTDFNKIDYEELYNQVMHIKTRKSNLPILFIPDFNSTRAIEEYYTNHTRKFGNRTCFVPWKYAQILANGDVTVLTRCFDVTFGNIFEEEFENIWNGKKIKSFRSALKENSYFPACLRCCGLF